MAINKTILVMEDEDIIRRSLADKLKEDGFEVLEAKDGEEGVELALKQHPDLIMLDILMPKKDGMEVLRELRGDEWGKQVPIIILTNLNEADKIAEAVKYKAYDFLIKTDLKLSEIVAKIKEKLKI